LTHHELVRAQDETLAAPRRQAGSAARVLFASLDLIYGKPRTLSKFKVLELVARVPYQAWEQAAYIAITHIHEHTGMAHRIYDRVTESRSAQDNEQWHLLIIDELIAKEGIREGRLKFFWLPQLISTLVAEHPEWETVPFESDFIADYGTYDSLADVFRQIGHDERVHKQESEAQLGHPRFR
jgi:ubiquinol oxidase